MKRDLDLARQLLLDIENRGADCSVGVLRTGGNHETSERIRYHLRLLIDAGLLKEIDRTAEGIPCVRLTNQGHELLELSGDESRWREAKLVCKERTGGLSLAVIHSLLARWAMGPIGRRMRRPRSYYAPSYRLEEMPGRYREQPLYYSDYYPVDQRDLLEDDYEHYAPLRPECRERRRVIGPADGDTLVDAELRAAAHDYIL